MTPDEARRRIEWAEAHIQDLYPVLNAQLGESEAKYYIEGKLNLVAVHLTQLKQWVMGRKD